jgi:hypothetical protein
MMYAHLLPQLRQWNIHSTLAGVSSKKVGQLAPAGVVHSSFHGINPFSLPLMAYLLKMLAVDANISSVSTTMRRRSLHWSLVRLARHVS